ncbi:MAG: 30S ribosomal protein S20 [Terrimicrobiaceae bacterium]
MANIKSAAKRARQSERRNQKNSSVISALKTSQKRLQSALGAGKAEEARKEFQSFSSSLDKAAKRGIIHKNAADRRKGSFNRALSQPAAK